jgi:uncharacterized protein (TIGR03000 family)
MRNRILFSAVLFFLAVAGSAFLTAPAQAQGYYPPGARAYGTPLSINSPGYYHTTVNLAAFSPAIVNTYNPPNYRGTIISYGGYSPLVTGGAYVTSPLFTGTEAAFAPAGTTGPMGEFSLYNPAANEAYANAAYANAYANAAYANAYANAAYANAYANAAYANAYAAQAQTELYSPQVAVPVAYTQLQAGPSSPGETNALNSSSLDLTPNGDSNSEESITRSRRSGRRSTAYIDVRVPANAELWVEGVKTRQKGRVRRFVSPPLTSGRDFAYNVRVTWTANGKKVTKRQRVVVRAGDWVRLNWATPTRGTAGAMAAR